MLIFACANTYSPRSSIYSLASQLEPETLETDGDTSAVSTHIKKWQELRIFKFILCTSQLIHVSKADHDEGNRNCAH